MNGPEVVLAATGVKTEGATAPAVVGPGTGFEQLMECLDILREEVDRTTPEDLEIFDDEDLLFFTAAWQTIELGLQALAEYREATRVLGRLAADSQEAAEGAERTASGLIEAHAAAGTPPGGDARDGHR